MSPIAARVTGIAITLNKENPSKFDPITLTNKMAVTIVAGTDFLIIPKYSGINPIPAEDNALNSTVIACSEINLFVSGSVIK